MASSIATNSVNHVFLQAISSTYYYNVLQNIRSNLLSHLVEQNIVKTPNLGVTLASNFIDKSPSRYCFSRRLASPFLHTWK